MTQQLEPELPQPTPRGGGRLVVAGVAFACVAGASLGLWARPAAQGRREGPQTPRAQMVAAAAVRPRLEIIIAEAPAPIGAPLEVMPAHAQLAAAPARSPEPGPTPSWRAPALIKVDTPAAPPIEPVRVAARPEPKPAKAEVQVAKAKSKPAEVETRLAKADPPKAKPKASKTELAKAEKTKAEKAEAEKIQLAKAEKRKARKLELAKAEKRRAREAEAKMELAKAEREAEKAEAAKKSTRLASVVKAVKAVPKKLKPKTVELAEAKPVKSAAAKPKARDMTRAADRTCASSDPGEALVCANPRLAQRDRQLQRAFRDAESAGVPASALRRQQDRWIAAREAPWAVEDVYEARIAELNDLARDAGDY